MNDPKVSLIVPIYNSERFLHRCVDSLVYQTLEEIEILLVDNLSEDRSFEIMKQYESSFPGKVYALQLCRHYDGPGAGRNLGIEYSKGDYIGFADSDDYFEYDAVEKMYCKAVKEGCDLIYCSSYDVKCCKKKLTRSLSVGSKEEILTVGSMVFWNKLFSRALIDKTGKIPENMIYEDLAYCPQAVSNAENIGYIDEPLYYYIIREDSCVNTPDPAHFLQELDAMEHSLEYCTGNDLDIFADSVGMRLCNDIRDKWQFTDAYIAELKKLRPYLEKSRFLKHDKRNLLRVKRYLDLPEETIPNILYIYVPGDGKTSEDAEIYKNAFYNGTTVKYLDPSSVSESEKNADRTLTAFYLGLCAIYKTGGIYIHNSVRLCAYLNCLKYNEAFFSFRNGQSFSEKIFGCKKGNPVVKRMIEFTKNAPEGSTPEMILHEILCNEINIPLNDKTNIYDYPVSIYGTPVFVNDVGAKMHIAEHMEEK